MIKIDDIKPGMYFKSKDWIPCLYRELKYELPANVLIMICAVETFSYYNKKYIVADGIIYDSHKDITKKLGFLELSGENWNSKFERIEMG